MIKSRTIATAMKPYPLLFRPNLQETVWGGTRIKPLKGLASDKQPIGESWDISGIAGRESIVANGALAGRSLSDAISLLGADLLGQKVFSNYRSTGFPMLVKIIDAARDLSIQVHPNEELAQARHHKHGKAEMWYVMHAEPGTTLLAGFSKEITPEEYERRVKNGTIVEVLARHEAHTGDVFYIPAGRVHALCGGITVCEIQQSSDITYRLFDYNRPDLTGHLRQLHTAEAKQALDYQVYPSCRTEYDMPDNGAVCVVECPYFVVNVISAATSVRRSLKAEDCFVTLTCVEGSCTVSIADDEAGHDTAGTVELATGDSCLIPAAIADYVVESSGSSPARLLESWAK